MIARPLALLLFAATALAQDAVERIPPHLVVETVGPDGWRARLGPTNVGGLLASEEGQQLWRPQVEPMLGFWKMMVGDEAAYSAASERLFAYRGALRLAMVVDPDADTATHAAAVLSGDGRSDLDALGEDVRQLLERSIPGEWREAAAGGRTLRLRTTDDGAISAPFRDGEHLVVLAGPSDSITTALGLAQHLLAQPLRLGDKAPDSPALLVTLDLHALIRASELGEADDFEIAKALGLDALDELTIALGAAGPRVSLDVGVTLRSEPRGIVRAFLPPQAGVSALAQLLPAGAPAWKVGRFDCGALYEGVLQAVTSGREITREEARAEMRKDAGVDLDTDLFAHMTDELLVVGSPFQDFDRASESTWILAWRLRDDAKFEKAFDTVINELKPFVTTAETVDAGGVTLRRYGNMVDYDLWMGAGNGLFVISGGRDAEASATDLLQKAKAGAPDPKDNPQTWFRGLDRYLPAGVNGVAELDLDQTLGIPVEWWHGLLAELVPMPRGRAMSEEEAEAQQERVRALLRRHDLTRLRTATGTSDAGREWHWRLFW